jgi:transposase-like protein
MKAQLNRFLLDDGFPFLLVDALYLKIREDGRVRSRGVMMAVRINSDGYREVLGMMVGDTESQTAWSEFFSSLKDLRLHGVNIFTSDDHSGLVMKCILMCGVF